jgi:hypothetical protein
MIIFFAGIGVILWEIIKIIPAILLTAGVAYLLGWLALTATGWGPMTKYNSHEIDWGETVAHRIVAGLILLVAFGGVSLVIMYNGCLVVEGCVWGGK